MIMVWCVTSVFGTGRLHIVQGHMMCKNIVKASDSSPEWVSQQAMPLWHWRPNFRARLASTVVQSQCFWMNMVLKIYHARVTARIWILSKIYEAFWSPKCTRKPSQTSNAVIGELISVWVRDDRLRGACKELIHSMLARVAALNRAKDSFTKYWTNTMLHFDTLLCYFYGYIGFT